MKKFEDVDWKVPKLELVNNSVQGIKLTLGDVSREINAEIVQGMISHLKQWLSWREHWIHVLMEYENYSLEKIRKELDLEEKAFDDENNEYRIGDEFSAFLETSSKNGRMADNNQAAKIIRKDWNTEFPEHKKDIEIDPEMSYCYIYTKKKDVAEKFLWWSYNKYKKPVIDEILNTTEK
jgi:hypothetical protein